MDAVRLSGSVIVEGSSFTIHCLTFDGLIAAAMRPAGGPSRRYEQNVSGWLVVQSPATKTWSARHAGRRRVARRADAQVSNIHLPSRRSRPEPVRRPRLRPRRPPSPLERRLPPRSSTARSPDRLRREDRLSGCRTRESSHSPSSPGTRAARPRHPACAAATAPVRVSATSSGTQSAAWTATAQLQLAPTR